MTNAPAPIEYLRDLRRRGVGEWGRPLLDECGFEDLGAFANGHAQYRRAVGQSSTKGTPGCPQLAITTHERNGTLGSPTVPAGAVSAGARYASAKQTRAALRRHQDPSGTGRGPDDVAQLGRGV
jgi:hypothetical protein